jgi:hypothetical protein
VIERSDSHGDTSDQLPVGVSPQLPIAADTGNLSNEIESSELRFE